MRFSTLLLFLVLLAGVGETSGKGLLRSGYTGASRSSSKWKYAAAGVGGGVLLGYGLAYTHYRYRDYRNEFDDQDWYRNDRYYGNWQTRPIDCTPTGGMREYDTDGWLIAQVTTSKTPAEIVSGEFEVDLFNELMYRIPCSPPTQTAVLNICQANRAVTDEEMRVPGICAIEAVFTSEHTEARRRLLQTTGTGTVIVVAIGLDPKDFRLGESEAEMALREALADPNSELKKDYSLNSVVAAEVSAGVALKASLAMICAVLFVIIL